MDQIKGDEVLHSLSNLKSWNMLWKYFQQERLKCCG